MIEQEIDRLTPGIYKVYWSDCEGTSLASIGLDEQGNPWLAPINWLGPVTNAVGIIDGEAYTQPALHVLRIKIDKVERLDL